MRSPRVQPGAENKGRRENQFWFVWFRQSDKIAIIPTQQPQSCFIIFRVRRSNSQTKRGSLNSTLGASLNKSDADSRCCTALTQPFGCLSLEIARSMSARLVCFYLSSAINPVSDRNEIIYVAPFLIWRVVAQGINNKRKMFSCVRLMFSFGLSLGTYYSHRDWPDIIFKQTEITYNLRRDWGGVALWEFLLLPLPLWTCVEMPRSLAAHSLFCIHRKLP